MIRFEGKTPLKPSDFTRAICDNFRDYKIWGGTGREGGREGGSTRGGRYSMATRQKVSRREWMARLRCCSAFCKDSGVLHCPALHSLHLFPVVGDHTVKAGVALYGLGAALATIVLSLPVRGLQPPPAEHSQGQHGFILGLQLWHHKTRVIP